MILQAVGCGKGIYHRRIFYGTDRLRWIAETASGHSRDPQETVTDYTLSGGFFAAGKPYISTGQLVLPSEKGEPWFRDCYGREVLYLTERFPCFDSFDFLWERRCFRYYFICENYQLTCIQTTDGLDTVIVTEDLQDLKCSLWQEFLRLGYYQ